MFWVSQLTTENMQKDQFKEIYELSDSRERQIKAWWLKAEENAELKTHSTKPQIVISRSALLLTGTQRKECSWRGLWRSHADLILLLRKEKGCCNQWAIIPTATRFYSFTHTPHCSPSSLHKVVASAPLGDSVTTAVWPAQRLPWAHHCVPMHKHPPVWDLRAQASWVTIQTAQIREPSLFHAKAVMVYRWAISLGLPSSQALRRGLQFRTRNLWERWDERDIKNSAWLTREGLWRGEFSIRYVVPVIAANNNGLATGTGGCCGEFFLWRVPAVVKGLNHAAFLPISDNLLVTACSHNAVGSPGEGIRRTGMHCQFTLQQTRTPWTHEWPQLLAGLCAQPSQWDQYGTFCKAQFMGAALSDCLVCRKTETRTERCIHYYTYLTMRRILIPVRLTLLTRPRLNSQHSRV